MVLHSYAHGAVPQVGVNDIHILLYMHILTTVVLASDVHYTVM